MTAKDFKQLELSKLKPNPWNPRDEEDFKGDAFHGLVESIGKVGVLQPILVRPLKKDSYEIIFGECRWRASCEVAKSNGGLKKGTIPAMVREMTDDEAFDACVVENLHRKDLSYLQEARMFKAWEERYGKKGAKKDVVQDLSVRTAKSAGYINRRIKIMDLPEKVLKAWDKGQISFGHCEQLLRLQGDEKKIDQYVSKVRYWDGYSVTRMRRDIDEESVELQHAAFDLEKAGCNACQSNTDVQRNLFGADLAGSKTACNNPKCFKKNQNEGLLANWEKKYRKRYGTNGFRFYEGYNEPKHQPFGKDHYGCKHKEPAEKCADCKDLVTVLEISGKVHCKQACLNEKCYTLLKSKKEIRVEKEQIGGASTLPNESAGPEAPRVSWHGQHFREEFYQEIMPSWIEALAADDVKILRLTLSAILNSNLDAENEFFIRYFDKKRQDDDPGGCYGRVYHHVSDEQVWTRIEGMDAAELLQAIKELAQYITLHKPTTDHGLRGRIAAHLGIDLARDWKITQSYLDKKTKAEILAFGEQLGIFADPKAEAFLKTLGKRKFSALKKAELDRVILESGVDLSGKVPAEILDLGDTRDSDEDEGGCMDYVSCPHFDECEHIAQKCKHQRDEDDKPPCCFECDDLEGCDERCKLYGIRTCRECGCTDDDACEGGCSWVEDDLCSACAEKEAES